MHRNPFLTCKRHNKQNQRQKPERSKPTIISKAKKVKKSTSLNSAEGKLNRKT